MFQNISTFFKYQPHYYMQIVMFVIHYMECATPIMLTRQGMHKKDINKIKSNQIVDEICVLYKFMSPFFRLHELKKRNFIFQHRILLEIR